MTLIVESSHSLAGFQKNYVGGVSTSPAILVNIIGGVESRHSCFRIYMKWSFFALGQSYQFKNLYRAIHPVCHNVLLLLVLNISRACLPLLGQQVATVSAHQPGVSPKTSSLKPCDRLDEQGCNTDIQYSRCITVQLRSMRGGKGSVLPSDCHKIPK